jgi:hypothetical protein
MPEAEFIDVNEAAKRLCVSASFLNKLRLAGGGPPYAKFSKSVRYDWRLVQEWAASRMRRSTSETAAA